MGGRILEYEAKDILRKGIAEGRAEGKAEGRAEGKAEGRAEGRNFTFFELVRDGILSPKDAASRIHLTETAFIDQMNSYFKEAQATT